MKLQDRKKYYGLAILKATNTSMPLLCQFCKYFTNYEKDSWCMHPIEEVSDINFDRAKYGADCWAFRPRDTFNNLSNTDNFSVTEEDCEYAYTRYVKEGINIKEINQELIEGEYT